MTPQEQLRLQAAEARAVEAEYALLRHRQYTSARSRALAEFIKRRAPELWPDYAAISANGSVYGPEYTQEPVYESEAAMARHRTEAAERRATELLAHVRALRAAAAPLLAAPPQIPLAPAEGQPFTYRTAVVYATPDPLQGLRAAVAALPPEAAGEP